MEVCDKIQESQHSKDYLKAIVKRLNHQDPHIVMQAITLLDACINNCGRNFHLEVASRDFETEFRKLLSKSQPKINERLRGLLKKWAEGYFKTDPQLSLIPALYTKLRQEGMDFSQVDGPKPKQSSQPKDPNAVSSQQEVDDIAKAIELSLKDTQPSPKSGGVGSAASSLYPSTNISSTSDGRKVRALYDFEAAEDNELTFFAGEIIYILDDSDPNWWKGCNQRGEGLFPANFVTADLSVEPEKTKRETKKSVQFNEAVQVKTVKLTQQVEIDEGKIDRLLYLLHEADPNEDCNDSEQMVALEEEVNAMGPLIDTELERVDRKHAQLTQLSSSLVEALNLYYTLMREPLQVAKPPPQFHPPPSQIYNGPTYSLPPEQYMMGPPGTGAGFPIGLPRPEDLGPQSLPPQPTSSQPMTFPPSSGLPNYGAPFPISGVPSHPQNLPPPSSYPNPPPTNGQQL
ncbi:signal transducing adaptor molecule isoform X2 [Lycorma delicatula]